MKPFKPNVLVCIGDPGVNSQNWLSTFTSFYFDQIDMSVVIETLRNRHRGDRYVWGTPGDFDIVIERLKEEAKRISE